MSNASITSACNSALVSEVSVPGRFAAIREAGDQRSLVRRRGSCQTQDCRVTDSSGYMPVRGVGQRVSEIKSRLSGVAGDGELVKWWR